MTTFDSHKNFAWGIVATAPSPKTSGTSLVLKTGHGANFQTAPFNAVVLPAGTMNPFYAIGEIIRVTNIATNTLTIVRAQESSTAASISVGDVVMSGIPTKQQLEDIETAVNARILKTGDSMTGEYAFNSSTTGKLTIGSDGTGLPMVSLFTNSSDSAPKLGLGTIFGAPMVGFGAGGASAVDTFLTRQTTNRLILGFGAGTFGNNISPDLSAQTGTTYTTLLADAGKHITRSNGSASTQTLPQDSAAAIPIGTVIPITNIGAGVVTFAAGTGATITGLVSIRQYQQALMTKVSTNGWNITGDNSADIVAASIGDVGGNPSKKITLNGNSFSYSTFSDHTFKVWDGVSSYAPILTLATGLVSVASDINIASGKQIKINSVNLLDTDVTLAANSDTVVATQKATKAYVDNRKMVSIMIDAGGSTFDTTTTETTVLTGGATSIPSATLNTNGDVIKFEFTGIELNNTGSAVTFTHRLKVGGNTLTLFNAYSQASNAFGPWYRVVGEVTRTSNTTLQVSAWLVLTSSLNTTISQQYMNSATWTVSSLASNALSFDYTIQMGTSSATAQIDPRHSMIRVERI